MDIERRGTARMKALCVKCVKDDIGLSPEG